MNPKLIKTLLLAAALGFFLLWILEILRTDLSHSYWLMMLSLTFLLLHQYYRLRTLPENPKASPKTKSTKQKKK
ncbi:hypothetical protein [Salmonirosea aquatica]|uniref:Uncharacterized protein n=1 Tax=Salmonirosea aquatica TaxID=2654236 RepID=A0A7C9B9T9_9BACT|nr:hypothetical protein [Cytophagaceae bacterium SJW1-29]